MVHYNVTNVALKEKLFSPFWLYVHVATSSKPKIDLRKVVDAINKRNITGKIEIDLLQNFEENKISKNLSEYIARGISTAWREDDQGNTYKIGNYKIEIIVRPPDSLDKGKVRVIIGDYIRYDDISYDEVKQDEEDK